MTSNCVLGVCVVTMCWIRLWHVSALLFGRLNV